jgi:class 3 adenylate cyclase
MRFDAPGIERSFLTMLVVDLRNSSTFFRDLDLAFVEEMLRDFSAMTRDVLRTVIGDVPEAVPGEVNVVKFTGDGFLILFAEPNAHIRTARSESARQLARGVAPPLIGPARALAVAKRLRRTAAAMFVAWNQRAFPRQGTEDVGIVSGIVDGHVAYGPIAQPPLEQRDVGGEPVVRAFRFAQVREDGLTGDKANRILVCDATRQEVQDLLARTDGSSTVVTEILGVEFQAVTVPEHVKGVADRACFQAVWP